VKELLKSVHIWQRYRKNKSGTFLMAHGVVVVAVLVVYRTAMQIHKSTIKPKQNE